MKHVMVDLETLATTADAVIVSIGAVRFDEKNMADEAFYTPVSIDSNLAVGRRISESTLVWWMKQSDAARAVFNEPSEPLDVALKHLAEWIGRDGCEIWSNGASFDIPMLEHAYTQFGIEVPWKFWNSRCYRTMKSIHTDVPSPGNALKHNALSDAIAQAQHLQAIWNKTNGKKART